MFHADMNSAISEKKVKRVSFQQTNIKVFPHINRMKLLNMKRKNINKLWLLLTAVVCLFLSCSKNHNTKEIIALENVIYAHITDCRDNYPPNFKRMEDWQYAKGERNVNIAAYFINKTKRAMYFPLKWNCCLTVPYIDIKYSFGEENYVGKLRFENERYSSNWNEKLRWVQPNDTCILLLCVLSHPPLVYNSEDSAAVWAAVPRIPEYENEKLIKSLHLTCELNDDMSVKMNKGLVRIVFIRDRNIRYSHGFFIYDKTTKKRVWKFVEDKAES